MKIEMIYKGYTIIKEGFTKEYPYLVFLNEPNTNNIQTFIECEKSIKDAKYHIDEDFYSNNRNKILTMSEHFEKYGNEYCWESTLEEDLIEEDWDNQTNNPKSREFKPKDIVMVNDFAGVHRILIITKIDKKDNNDIYYGYLLSSNVKKANKNSKFSNNIYINNYSTILDRGPKNSKEAIIKIDDLRSFTKNNFSKSGTYKGTVTDEFFDFILKCADNYKNRIRNSKIYCEK